MSVEAWVAIGVVAVFAAAVAGKVFSVRRATTPEQRARWAAQEQERKRLATKRRSADRPHHLRPRPGSRAELREQSQDAYEAEAERLRRVQAGVEPAQRPSGRTRPAGKKRRTSGAVGTDAGWMTFGDAGGSSSGGDGGGSAGGDGGGCS